MLYPGRGLPFSDTRRLQPYTALQLRVHSGFGTPAVREKYRASCLPRVKGEEELDCERTRGGQVG